MKIEIVGKNGFKPSDANKEYIETKLQKLDQYFDEYEELETRVVCKEYPSFHKLEITIPTKNLTLRAEVADKDLYTTVDLAMDKIIGQIRKYKTKGKNRSNKDPLAISMHDSEFCVEGLDKEMKANQLVRNKEIELKPMNVEEALQQMELLGHDFFIFKDKDTSKTNLVYLREDGQYALIETK